MAPQTKKTGLGHVVLNKYDLINQTPYYGEASSPSNDYSLLQQFQGNQTKSATGAGSFYFPNTKRTIASTGDGYSDPTVVSSIASQTTPTAPIAALNTNGGSIASWGNDMNSPAKTPAPYSYLSSAGKSMGFSGWGDGRSNGTIYQNDSGDYMKSGMFTDSLAKPGEMTFAQYGKANPKSTMTEKEHGDLVNAQGYLDNQSFSQTAGAVMGGIQTGLGVMSYFDNKALNKKNMQLMDQQIADNAYTMEQRKGRNADIVGAFGAHPAKV